jgi:hypothetical protein
MSGLFSKPSTPDIPKPPAPLEDVAVVEETAEEARQREKKRLLSTGRRTTILSGIQSALKKRLGE